MFRRFFKRIQKLFHRKNKVHPLNTDDTESCSFNAECPVELFLRADPRQVPENVTPIDEQTDTEKTVIPNVVEYSISEDEQTELELLQSKDQSLGNKIEEVQEDMENTEPPKLQDYSENVSPAGSNTPLQEQNIDMETEDTESSDNRIERISPDLFMENAESSTETFTQNSEDIGEVIEQRESSHCSTEITLQTTEDEQEVIEEVEGSETSTSSTESITQDSIAEEQVIEERKSSDSSSTESVLEKPSNESFGKRTKVLEILVQEVVETTGTAKPLEPPKRAIPVFSALRGYDPLQRLKLQESKEMSGKQPDLLSTGTNKPPGAANTGIPVFSRFRGSNLVPSPMGQERRVGPNIPPMRSPDLLQQFKNHNSTEKIPSAIPRITQRQINVNPSNELGAKTHMGDFQLHKLLGAGNFGRVYLAEQKQTRKKVAIKMIPREKVCDALAVRGVMREKEILELAKKKNHPFLIGLVTYFETQHDMCLAMDYASGGDLSSVMTRTLSIETSVFYTACIVLGVKFLHENKIVHRDLKPENIMLDERGFPKITDFGLSKAGIGFGNRMCGRCGTPAYWAPEIFVKTFYTRSVDWWAVGVILYQMVVGEVSMKQWHLFLLISLYTTGMGYIMSL
ncbi:hypothetical protein XENTR_v10022453 [Xenopus tropicalis]|nr:hypothetical protein XENTR_v10022453 [Xenopus tropicalis]KAE8588308.1 hypothetical protein XENTR_v10022453 [Xenopus tropicalis]